MKRREFIQNSAAIAAVSFLPFKNLFESAQSQIKIGYSAITWGGKDVQAISEIASLGYKGIQLRANSFPIYKDKPQELKDLLDKAGLTLAMFSSGNVEIAADKVEASIDQHVKHAEFVSKLGGKAIQLTNSLRKNNQVPSKEELVHLAEVMNEIGGKTKAFGVQTTYHNHMHQWGETPEEVDVIVNYLNPDNVKLELDVAHYFQGGGNPAEAVLKFRKVLHTLHIKDVEAPIKGKDDPKSYKFVELGQGKVNLNEVFQNLTKIKFSGWAIVELDGVPSPDKSPLQCATTSKEFLKGIGQM
ncbi:sugar phosphate isomerase/epimerase [Sandaracinomonas limnophila]|uniref:Sugar phosphate isomerase/epimerase n=1 Tax=Sandaracinomonas limnophila TaxID=1862386 RepID=A0A437PQW2_9BACT|nr:sugar phosphate isomerase/epimerase [Sandaracinomonas limnophila]RVU24644.1 sugar phosphate isomerase/epimerase [Sandaracinomonas limnophila]